jgi:hypothetical protein
LYPKIIVVGSREISLVFAATTGGDVKVGTLTAFASNANVIPTVTPSIAKH